MFRQIRKDKTDKTFMRGSGRSVAGRSRRSCGSVGRVPGNYGGGAAHERTLTRIASARALRKESHSSSHHMVCRKIARVVTAVQSRVVINLLVMRLNSYDCRRILAAQPEVKNAASSCDSCFIAVLSQNITAIGSFSYERRRDSPTREIHSHCSII